MMPGKKQHIFAQNGVLMMIYDGRIRKNHLQQIQAGGSRRLVWPAKLSPLHSNFPKKGGKVCTYRC